ncbi:hypothetical protein ACFLU8_04960 [Chloroflexota bacterium]
MSDFLYIRVANEEEATDSLRLGSLIIVCILREGVPEAVELSPRVDVFDAYSI